ncbi:hypothetical protein L6164_018179 [Bauhinia variegata]|uniref:Uncharacterized protein n=1 Tax=Bauhinia variegata TaxID=167791 RepID=A0ACB9NAG7_BAUVA|nr:hypothetical protein L6164_018179 [Bauhinia variegata]
MESEVVSDWSDTSVIRNNSMASNDKSNDGNEAFKHGLENSLNSNEEVEEPKVGMRFSSEEEIFTYYTTFARQKGFGVYRRTSKMEEDGKKYFTLACVRAGKSASSKRILLNPNPITKTQCKARLNACLCLDGRIRVSSIVLEHNHELCPSKPQFFRCNKKTKHRLTRKPELNNPLEISVGSLVADTEEYGNLTFGEKDHHKGKRLRMGTKSDAEAFQNFFVQMQKQDNGFYVMDFDEECQLRNVFWADGRSKAAYEYFGDVVTFDTTYLKNKYHIPLAPFVGVNHHGQSVLLGCALLSNEDVETFTWLFKTWLACMSGRAPNAIITDQNEAIKRAIEVVLPEARHRWCLWHLMKRVPEKLKRYSQYESIKMDLQAAVYDASSKDDFIQSWKKMIEAYDLHDNEWLNGLYDERHCWVPAYLKDTFWAGMSTIERRENMHAFFDGYLNLKTTLKEFLEQYDNALSDKVEKECLADFSSLSTPIHCVSHFGIEYQFQRAFTNAKFKEFQEEIACIMYCNASFERKEGMISTYSVVESKKVHEIIEYLTFSISYNEDGFEVQCECHLFEFKGILCRHILSLLKLIRKTESVPSKYVFSRWRKDLKRRHTLVKSSYANLADNPEAQRLDKMCNAFYDVACVEVNSDSDFMKVMKWIHDLKDELSCKEKSSRRIEASPTVSDNSMISKDNSAAIAK